MRYIVHTGKFIFAFLCCAIFMFLSAVFFLIQTWILSAACFLLGLLYAFIGLYYGAKVQIDDEKISCRQFPYHKKVIYWAEIQEVGVLGTRVLNRGKPKRSGEKFIYFSPHIMTDDEKFNMCLKWPPKDIIYMRYTFSRVQQIQSRWDQDIALYNTGELVL